MEEKKIEITQDEFMRKAAQVTASERISKLIKEMPALMLVFAVFVTELTHKIFDEESNESEATE